MCKLLSENEQLPVRDLQVFGRRRLRWRISKSCRRRIFLRWLRFTIDHLDLDRNATLLLDLSNGDGPISAIEHAFDQSALRVPGAIRELWHGWKIKPKPK